MQHRNRQHAQRETSAMLHERERAQNAKRVLRGLKKLYPKTTMFLDYKTEWELLVAVILSAQCTDKKVNEVTKSLFRKYRTIDAYANADPKEFERDIFQTGFFRSKTKHIQGAARMVKHVFHGRLPKTMDEMLRIPGVGRKTANVVLGNAHGTVEGIAVDTHVKRLSHVLGLSCNTTPAAIERDLMKLFPKSEWFTLTYRLISYGREYCPARRHEVAKCPLGHTA